MEHAFAKSRENSYLKPCIKSHVAPEVEEAVVQMAIEYLVYGQEGSVKALRRSLSDTSSPRYWRCKKQKVCSDTPTPKAAIDR